VPYLEFAPDERKTTRRAAARCRYSTRWTSCRSASTNSPTRMAGTGTATSGRPRVRRRATGRRIRVAGCSMHSQNGLAPVSKWVGVPKMGRRFWYDEYAEAIKTGGATGASSRQAGGHLGVCRPQRLPQRGRAAPSSRSLVVVVFVLSESWVTAAIAGMTTSETANTTTMSSALTRRMIELFY